MRLGGWPWAARGAASGRPKVEDPPLSTARHLGVQGRLPQCVCRSGAPTLRLAGRRVICCAHVRAQCRRRRGRFHSQISVNSKTQSLGNFDTAVEAAVAYARAERHLRSAGSGAAEGTGPHTPLQSPVREDDEGGDEGAARAGGLPPTGSPRPAEPVVEEAEGWRLHLSKANSSGYTGVTRKASGSFEARMVRNKEVRLAESAAYPA